MNILVFANGSLSVAGQELKLSVEFAKLGHKVHILCNDLNKLFDVGSIEEHENLIVYNEPYSQYRYKELYIEDKIDVCFGMDQSVAPFVAEYKLYTNVPSYCMFLDFPIHVIDSVDTLTYNFDYAQRYYYWISCALQLDGVIFNNAVAVEEFRRRYKRDAHLVWYAISNDDALDKLSVTQPSKDFFVGCNRLILYKGTDYTIKALKKLPYRYKHIFVSGDENHLNMLKSLCEEIDNEIIFYNKLGENEKMQMIYNARLLVYPQVTDWIGGLSIIEGWSVKTPGVCFDFPVLREIYGDAVLYAKQRSVVELRDQIRALYEDEELNKEMSQRGYDRFKKYFTRKTMAENLLKVFGA